MAIRGLPTSVTAGDTKAEDAAEASEGTNYREVADSLLAVAHGFLGKGQLDQALKTMAPGYDAAKRLNDMELLHNYAVTYAEIYGRMRENGLASYYTSLAKWFSARLEQEEETSRSTGAADRYDRPDAGNWNGPPAENPSFLTGMQTGTIGILIILILLLIIENVRLRKRMRDL